MDSYDRVRDLFRARGVPLTHQRMAVYEELASRRDHPSAESLYASLKKRYPTLSLATVYKTLQTLEELQVIARVDSPSAQSRYDAITRRHHHQLCTKCGAISDFFDPNLDHLKIPRTDGFTISGYTVHFHGICAECARASENNNKTPLKRRIKNG